MLPDSAVPLVQRYLPQMEAAGRKYSVDPLLLLAMGWVASGLDSAAAASSGAQGLFLMRPSAAGRVAGRKGLSTWNLHDPAMAIDFAADFLSHMIQRFVLPRLAVAAFYAGPAAVARAGNQVPSCN